MPTTGPEEASTPHVAEKSLENLFDDDDDDDVDGDAEMMLIDTKDPPLQTTARQITR
jgi:hypothetical protein